MSVSKTQKLREALLNGSRLTKNDIVKKFKIANPSAAIFQLRQSGFEVDTAVNSKGLTVYEASA